jgi:hypothetical protein
MIDNKKIEDAAKSLRKDFNDDVTQGFLVEFGFEKGAKWAIDEFLKDLWHPFSDKPHGSFPILLEYEKGKYYVSYFDKNKDGWSNERIIRWLNIDDLLPK